jgi:hypothetical protein
MGDEILPGIRAVPVCPWCTRRVRIRADGTAPEHRGCPGGGRPVNLTASCGCAVDALIGVWAYPPGRAIRRAPVSATVCARPDHRAAVRRWVLDRAGVPASEIGFTPHPTPSGNAG